MKYTVGVTVGKFMPLHKGHELMIKMGSKILDDLVVLVSGTETDEIPLDVRVNWIVDFVKKSGLENVCVLRHTDKSPTPIEIDSNGTVLDEEFQQYWADEFFKHEPNLTHIVSSDWYGKTLADRMGLEWLPVDPTREMFPISATMIRENIDGMYNYISDSAKPYFQKKVVFVGPESTGKSTMSKNVASWFEGRYVPEYGRIVTEVKPDAGESEFENIFKGQKALVESAGVDKRLIVADTEAYTTFLFGQIYLDRDLECRKYHVPYDLYVLLAPTVEWVQDGNRVLEKQSIRWKFFEDMKQYLEDTGQRFVVVDDASWKDREAKVEQYVSEIL